MDFTEVLKRYRQAHFIFRLNKAASIKILTRAARMLFLRKGYQIAILDGFSYRQILPIQVQFGQ